MAASMTPEEIDALLTSIDSEEGSGKSESRWSANFGFFRRTDRVFRWREPPLKRYKEKYRSPVIKREDVIYNPPAGRLRNSNSVEVHPVEKYRANKR
ncbi:hypothetical protein AMJ80_12195 [bacterium SM23_31]|nr:MAG: hypothetical protein AMJ80_12195 [bacterium SM23_31]